MTSRDIMHVCHDIKAPTPPWRHDGDRKVKRSNADRCRMSQQTLKLLRAAAAV